MSDTHSSFGACTRTFGLTRELRRQPFRFFRALLGFIRGGLQALGLLQQGLLFLLRLWRGRIGNDAEPAHVAEPDPLQFLV